MRQAPPRWWALRQRGQPVVGEYVQQPASLLIPFGLFADEGSYLLQPQISAMSGGCPSDKPLIAMERMFHDDLCGP